MEEITLKKWETCRGLGYSFGYNQQEGPEHVLKADELVELFVDIVSKNGNLLLNIGPKPDGTISEIQTDRLRALGRWLATNGEAIFDSRPWERSSGQTADGVPIRFTRKGTAVYALLFDKPSTSTVLIRSFRPPEGAAIQMLGASGTLNWSQQGEDLKVTLPAQLPGDYAYTLKIAAGSRSGG
jgi:alpha-L-fucosidase